VEQVKYVLKDQQDQIQYFQQLQVQVEEVEDLIHPHFIQVLQEDQEVELLVQQEMLLKVEQEILPQ
jgi:hypothetical protein